MIVIPDLKDMDGAISMSHFVITKGINTGMLCRRFSPSTQRENNPFSV